MSAQSATRKFWNGIGAHGTAQALDTPAVTASVRGLWREGSSPLLASRAISPNRHPAFCFFTHGETNTITQPSKPGNAKQFPLIFPHANFLDRRVEHMRLLSVDRSQRGVRQHAEVGGVGGLISCVDICGHGEMTGERIEGKRGEARRDREILYQRLINLNYTLQASGEGRTLKSPP